MAARRLANSSVDWTAFYQRVPAREREIFRALKARSDAFVNKVHANPAELPKIDFAHYKASLPGLKMVTDFEQAYGQVSIPYPKDPQNLTEQIKAEEAKTMATSAEAVKGMEHEKVLSTEFLAKLDKLPRQEEFTMEMFNDYFPWTKMKNGETHKLFPFTKASQPENLTLNDSEMINKLLSKVGINVKV